MDVGLRGRRTRHRDSGGGGRVVRRGALNTEDRRTAPEVGPRPAADKAPLSGLATRSATCHPVSVSSLTPSSATLTQEASAGGPFRSWCLTWDPSLCRVPVPPVYRRVQDFGTPGDEAPVPDTRSFEDSWLHRGSLRGFSCLRSFPPSGPPDSTSLSVTLSLRPTPTGETRLGGRVRVTTSVPSSERASSPLAPGTTESRVAT